MKKCKNCQENDAVMYSKYTTGDFCSSKCARAYSTKEKRVDINKKVSDKLIGRKTREYQTIIKIKQEKIINIDDVLKRWKETGEKVRNTNNKKILEADYSTLSYERLKKRILLEQNNKCNRCGLNEWLGEKITLELEHKDGNHHNNLRENLEALCPNCHSLTPTWRGRNKFSNKNKISDELLLISLINHNFNMRQALLEVGLAAKGGNYNRCHKLKKEYDDLN